MSRRSWNVPGSSHEDLPQSRNPQSHVHFPSSREVESVESHLGGGLSDGLCSHESNTVTRWRHSLHCLKVDGMMMTSLKESAFVSAHLSKTANPWYPWIWKICQIPGSLQSFSQEDIPSFECQSENQLGLDTWTGTASRNTPEIINPICLKSATQEICSLRTFVSGSRLAKSWANRSLRAPLSLSSIPPSTLERVWPSSLHQTLYGERKFFRDIFLEFSFHFWI